MDVLVQTLALTFVVVVVLILLVVESIVVLKLVGVGWLESTGRVLMVVVVATVLVVLKSSPGLSSSRCS